MLNIAIVGNGIAGAAASLFLRRAGHHVTHFEQVRHGDSVGAGLLLQPVAQAVLHAAGLHQELWERGVSIQHIRAYFVASDQMACLDYGEFGSKARGCGVQRAALLELLQRGTNVDVDIQMNALLHVPARVTEVDARTGSVHTMAGERLGPFDLVVAADGARSAIRAQLPPALVVHDQAYQDAAIVCLVDDPAGLFSDGLLQRFHASTHVSTWPVGKFEPDGTSRVAVAMRVSVGELSRLASDPDDWLRRLGQVHPTLADWVRALPHRPTLLPYTYRDVATRRYFAHRVVLIGDAAHAMSPQLGLGASNGLLDAWLLAKHLDGPDSVARSLAKFDLARRSEVEKYQRISRMVTPFFQSDNRLVAVIRERSALGLSRSALFRRRALEAVCSIPLALDFGTMNKSD